jgi:Sulfotransferase family
MKQVRGAIAKALDPPLLAWAYLASYCKGRENRRLFDGVETYCMFLGYPHSGHSLIGSLLDAHPNAIVAHELDALKFVGAGFGKHQLYNLLLDNSRRFAQRGREWNSYAYEVSQQWQGRFNELRVIGDKKGGHSTLQLAEDPELLHRLQKTVAIDVKFVHVVRNPYDNVAAMLKHPPVHVRNPTLSAIVEDYFYRCETNAGLKERLGDTAVLDVRQESFVASPERTLRELCDFLGLGYDEDYLEGCASIVFESPHRSRHRIEWDSSSLATVRDGVERFDFLKGYSYEDR